MLPINSMLILVCVNAYSAPTLNFVVNLLTDSVLYYIYINGSYNPMFYFYFTSQFISCFFCIVSFCITIITFIYFVYMLYNYMFIYNYNLSLKEISLYRYTITSNAIHF